MVIGASVRQLLQLKIHACGGIRATWRDYKQLPAAENCKRKTAAAFNRHFMPIVTAPPPHT